MSDQPRTIRYHNTNVYVPAQTGWIWDFFGKGQFVCTFAKEPPIGWHRRMLTRLMFGSRWFWEDLPGHQ